MEMQQQMEAEGGERLMEMPSFRSIPGSQERQLFLLGHQPAEGETGPTDGGDDSDEDFEFACVSRDSLDGLEEPVAANEIFSDGRIRAVYPLLGKTLSFREFMAGDGGPPLTSSSASSASWELSDKLDGVPAKSYCAWATRSAPASPDLRKKSHSTGGASAASEKWRLRDLVAGQSHSDEKEMFNFVAAPGSSVGEAKGKKDKKKGQQPPPPPPAAAAGEEKKGKAKGRGGGKVVTEIDMVAAHRLYYTKGGAAAGDRRRSFLPYQKNLLGMLPAAAADLLLSLSSC